MFENVPTKPLVQLMYANKNILKEEKFYIFQMQEKWTSL
jgi:hypothetical protein